MSDDRFIHMVLAIKITTLVGMGLGIAVYSAAGGEEQLKEWFVRTDREISLGAKDFACGANELMNRYIPNRDPRYPNYHWGICPIPPDLARQPGSRHWYVRKGVHEFHVVQR